MQTRSLVLLEIQGFQVQMESQAVPAPWGFQGPVCPGAAMSAMTGTGAVPDPRGILDLQDQWGPEGTLVSQESQVYLVVQV